jgi:hypothetical protein
MSVKKTEQVVRDFLSNKSAEVLSIKGNWGVGKTYFWKKIVQQTTQTLCCEKYCYVSLFGIASLAELKATIFENLIEKTQIDKDFSTDNLKQNIDKLAKQWGWRGITKSRTFFSFVRAPINVEPWLFSLAFGLVKNTLICLDDLERKGNTLSTKDVLGLISYLKEERNCKVVLIFSDANFSEDNQQDYAQFREKSVDVEVRFSPTPAESAALVFTTTSESDTQLSSFTNALQISNIRILQRIKRAAGIVLPLLQDFDPQITRAALQTLALFGWSYYSHKHDTKIPSYQYVTAFGYHLGGQKTEQQQGWDAILQKYNFKATDELDVALSSVIENGFLNEDLVRKEAQKLNAQIIATKSIEAFREAWDIFYSFHDDDDEGKVVETFVNSLKNHVQYISPLNLNAVVGLLRELNRNEAADELIDFYIAQRGNDKKIFDLSENLRSWGEKPDEELEHKFNLQLATLEETPTIESVFTHLAKQQGWGWSLAQGEVLASATPDDFYKIFKSATGKTLSSYIKASLQYGQLDTVATDRQSEITKKAKEALLRIGNESLLNKIRLKRYGIYTEEQPSLPL